MEAIALLALVRSIEQLPPGFRVWHIIRHPLICTPQRYNVDAVFPDRATTTTTTTTTTATTTTTTITDC
ncbi:hypothetical protein KIN20_036984 [Parelaphostrongylus tenuis]|uniref:Uncharacterized protein n=1 Tax=Parelaphostrongylus tenuis TaxID=148309 RepID=A0AAD5WM34_PARTN|nr:hypothetical protein KIN20_036984 [Parelaphostrongylus tenuis]